MSNPLKYWAAINHSIPVLFVLFLYCSLCLQFATPIYLSDDFFLQDLLLSIFQYCCVVIVYNQGLRTLSMGSTSTINQEENCGAIGMPDKASTKHIMIGTQHNMVELEINTERFSSCIAVVFSFMDLPAPCPDFTVNTTTKQ